MAKLKTIKPLVATLPPLIGRAKGEKARDQYRRQTQPWRAWYKTSRWQKLRQAVLVRDAYTCKQTGALCIGKHPADNSPVVDHIIPHHGDERLFWDEKNLQTVSKAYHDGQKQKEERAQARW